MKTTKAQKLRDLLSSDQLEFIMEAHSGLSAKIVEEAGFKGIWASGLSMSAAHGVRDNNELSWTDVVNALKFMSNATTIPILLDADTGYGSFNNFVQLLQELVKHDIGGVVIEDKIFPKTNSFINGEKQELANIVEFSRKITAGKDFLKSIGREDFVICARLESYITGLGHEEAMKRAIAYAEAGADAILCHSKLADSSEIDLFMNDWKRTLVGETTPVIIVPTKYYKVPTQHFADSGISLIIWANHNLRSSIKSMQETTQQIFADSSLINVEQNVAKLEEVFRLQNAEALEIAEKKYLP
jgi:phosphoenolpyruvate phosphomutase